MGNATIVPGTEIIAHSLDPRQEYTVKVYDFKRPDKWSKEQLRTVWMVHETFSRLATAMLTPTMRIGSAVRVSAVDQLTYQEFIRSVPDPTVLAVVNMDPLRGSAVLQIDRPLVAAMLDRSYGGSIAGDEVARELTGIEEMAIESVAGRLLSCLGESWHALIGLKPRIGQIECRPQFAQIVPPSEMVILVSFEVTVGEANGMINFCVPYLTIEPLVDKLSARYWYSMVRRPDAPAVLGAERLAIDAELAAVTPEISLAELVKVLAGEPVPLHELTDGAISLYLGGERIAELEAEWSTVSGREIKLPVKSASPPSVDTARGEQERPNTVDRALAKLQGEMAGLRRDLRMLAENQRAVADEIDAGELSAEDPGIALGSEPRTLRPALAPLLATALEAEREQTLAFCLSMLAPETAAGVLSGIEEGRRAAVVRRLAELEEVEQQIRLRVGAYLSRLATSRAQATRSGGYDQVAEVLNYVPRGVEKQVMDFFIQSDKQLFEEIAKRMFVFEDFVLVDASAIQKLSERVSVAEFALAMKDVPAEVASHILNALDAERAAELTAAIETIGRVRRSDVEAAQREMIEELRELEKAGEVVVIRPDEVVE